MKLKFDRKTAALVLFGAAVVLLIANLVTRIIINSTAVQTGKEEINNSGVDSLFLLSLHNFGISNDWIKELKSKKSVKSYLVKVPADLSIPVILVEITTNFQDKEVEIISEEDNFSGNTETKIYVGNQIRLKSEFNYDNEIRRSVGTLSFVLKDFELGNSKDSLMLGIPETFSPLLLPSMRNFDISKFISEKKKTFSILLNDDIPEIKYKLRDNYSEDRIRSILYTIIRDFPGACFFVIDDNSDLYNSPAFEIIQNELAKRKIQLLKLGKLSNIYYENDLQLKNDFDNLIKNMVDGESRIIVINYEGFERLIPDIERFRKIGYKIVHPSQLVQEKTDKNISN